MTHPTHSDRIIAELDSADAAGPRIDPNGADVITALDRLTAGVTAARAGDRITVHTDVIVAGRRRIPAGRH